MVTYLRKPITLVDIITRAPAKNSVIVELFQILNSFLMNFTHKQILSRGQCDNKLTLQTMKTKQFPGCQMIKMLSSVILYSRRAAHFVTIVTTTVVPSLEIVTALVAQTLIALVYVAARSVVWV